MLAGKVTDYGDLLHVEQWLIKGRRFTLRWNIGAPSDTDADDRHAGPASPRTGRGDIAMDLRADMQVPLALDFTDEMGNPATPPAGVTAVFTVDDPSVINLTTTGPTSANAAAVGVLGPATVHAEVTFSGQTLTGDLLIVVVPGLAERVTIAAGEPTEVTPDTP